MWNEKYCVIASIDCFEKLQSCSSFRSNNKGSLVDIRYIPYIVIFGQAATEDETTECQTDVIAVFDSIHPICKLAKNGDVIVFIGAAPSHVDRLTSGAS